MLEETEIWCLISKPNITSFVSTDHCYAPGPRRGGGGIRRSSVSVVRPSVRPSVCLKSRTSALTRKPKGLGRRNFAQGYPRSHATPTPTSRSKGQKVKSQGGAGAYCGGDLAAQLVRAAWTLCAGARIPLSESCDRGVDVCNDSNAFCDDDVCQCRPGYRPQDNTCCNLLTFLILLSPREKYCISAVTGCQLKGS